MFTGVEHCCSVVYFQDVPGAPVGARKADAYVLITLSEEIENARQQMLDADKSLNDYISRSLSGAADAVEFQELMEKSQTCRARYFILVSRYLKQKYPQEREIA